MKDAAAIAAQLVDIRNVGQHKCIKLTLHVPAEQAGLIMEAFGWPTAVDPVPVAVARLLQQTREEVGAETTNRAQPALGDVPARAPRNKLAQEAGKLAKTPLFHRYLEAIFADTDVGEEEATIHIRAFCAVTSRSQIHPDTPAGDKFIKLYDDFVCWRDADKFVENSMLDHDD